MPDLKLEPLLKASRPETLAPQLAPFLGTGDSLPRLAHSRLHAPTCYWATYERDDRRAVLKAFFTAEDYTAYAAQLQQHYPDRIDRPNHPRGGLRLLPELNAVLWAFPFDPSLPHLHRAIDSEWVAHALDASAPANLSSRLHRYNPEVGAITSYAREDDVLAYAKWSTDASSALIYVVMNRLWSSDGARSGDLRIARPLAYRPDEGVFFQAPVPGAPLSSHRNQRSFLDLVTAAGRALAAIHQADCPFGRDRTLEHDVRRLRHVLDDLRLSFPPLYKTLRLLVDQIDRRTARSRPTAAVPSHGDFKWDQFLAHEGEFSLIDFELFCQAEAARDIGYFAAYLPPSRPHDWEESTAAEALRGAFLDSYAAATGEPLDLERVSLFEAASLGIRALSHAWRRRGDWQLRAGGLLEMALTRLVEPEPLRTSLSA